ncbi:MAG: hypothetical protein K2X93_00030 [Candidatus Obscuribacterales bacterium]|nr:hypothetical protein [Candidatus Obscuribacterales bacterium]
MAEKDKAQDSPASTDTDVDELFAADTDTKSSTTTSTLTESDEKNESTDTTTPVDTDEIGDVVDSTGGTADDELGDAEASFRCYSDAESSTLNPTTRKLSSEEEEVAFLVAFKQLLGGNVEPTARKSNGTTHDGGEDDDSVTANSSDTNVNVDGPAGNDAVVPPLEPDVSEESTSAQLEYLELLQKLIDAPFENDLDSDLNDEFDDDLDDELDDDLDDDSLSAKGETSGEKIPTPKPNADDSDLDDDSSFVDGASEPVREKAPAPKPVVDEFDLDEDGWPVQKKSAKGDKPTTPEDGAKPAVGPPPAVTPKLPTGTPPEVTPKTPTPEVVPRRPTGRPPEVIKTPVVTQTDNSVPPKLEKVDVKESEASVANRAKVAAIRDDLDGFLANTPADSTPVDDTTLRDKIKAGAYANLSIPELRAALKLEAEEPEFGQGTGFKATEEAFRRSNQWINGMVINSHALLAKARINRSGGDPITLSTVGTDPLKPNEGFAHRPETFSQLFVDGQLDMKKFKEMTDSGQIKTSLILEPKGIPTVSDLNKMSNSSEWIKVNEPTLKEAMERVYANGQYRVLTEIFGIDKPGWAPPKEAAKLEAYNARMNEMLNLVFRVRNYAESIQSLNNVGGDFKSDALEKLKKLGDVGFDSDNRRVTKMVLRLPDSLDATPDNERVLQPIRDWLIENSETADQAVKEYEKSNPLRVSDVPMKGTAGLDVHGNLVYARDEELNLMSLVTADGKTFNRNVHGKLVDNDGNQATPEQLRSVDRAVSTGHFDYLTQNFTATADKDTYQITNTRHLYQDHLLNQQNLLGIHQGTITDTRALKPWQYALVQGQSGRSEFVRADRLNEFKAIQSFFHYGSKVAGIALDAGMIASGTIGIKGAVTAGKAGLIATGAMTKAVGMNAFRVVLGAGGFLDPVFRQMGETGQTIREARHIAILTDVTGNLANGGLGKMLLRGGPLLQGEGAAEVAKLIEKTAWMHRTEQVTKAAFMGGDAVWLPLMGQSASYKIERMYGNDPTDELREAAHARGGGVGDSKSGFASGGSGKVDAAAAAKSAFNLYGSLLGDQRATKMFDATRSALETNDETNIKKLRDTSLVGLFNPSAEALSKYRETHGGVRSSSVASVTLPTELQPNSKEKVADLIGLLFLSQKDGKLPEDGVLARRTLEVPGYSYTIAGTERTPPQTVHVPGDTVDQKVTVEQVRRELERAALDSQDPQSQMVAADALWRSGMMTTGKYAGVCLDIIQTQGDKNIQAKAYSQLSDLMVLKHIEENDPTITPDSRVRAASNSYGLSERDLVARLNALSGNHADDDVRALSSAVVKAHESRLVEAAAAPKVVSAGADSSTKPGVNDGVSVAGSAVTPDADPDAIDATAPAANPGEKPAEPVNAFKKYLDQWQALSNEYGAFHDAYVKEQTEGAKKALPTFDKRQPEDIAKFDTARKEKIAAAMALANLESGPNGGAYTRLINDTLMECAKLKDQSWISSDFNQRPSINVTMDAFNRLMDRRSSLSSDDKVELAKAGLDVLAITYQKVSGDTETQRSQRQVNYESAVAMLLVAGQLPTIFDANDKNGMMNRILAEEALYDLLTPKSIESGWGQHGMMRVAAIEGLSNLGKGDKDKSLMVMADRLTHDPETGFRERDPHVRAAALKALYKLEPAVFSQTPEQLAKRHMPNITPEYLLRYERDPVAVETLYAAHDDSRAYQDPESLASVADYSAEVAKLLQGKSITVTDKEVLDWIHSRQEKFGLLDKDAVQAASIEKARDTLWSGISGWFDQVFTGKETEQAREEVQARRERYAVRADRDKQFSELTNFKEMSPQDRTMAIKTLMYIVRNADQKLIAQDEQSDMRVRAAKALADIANLQASNNDRVDDKDTLGACVVSSLLDSSIDLPGEAKLHLLDAVNSLVKRDYGKDFDSGKKLGYTILTPQVAGSIFTEALRREKQQFEPDKPKERFSFLDKPSERELSTQVQLKCIDSIYQLRYTGAFPVLRARGPDSVLDPANPGSYIPEVRDRARQVAESLFYGVNWLKDDASKTRLTTTPEGDKAKIEAQLLGDQPMHYQDLIKDIFSSTQRTPHAVGRKDPRDDVLLQALHHRDHRVRLAAGMALSEWLPVSHPGRADALKALRELSGHKATGQAGIEDVKDSMRSLVASAGKKLTGKVDTDANVIQKLLQVEKLTPEILDQTARAIIASTKDHPIAAKDDPRTDILDKTLRHKSERVRLAAALSIVDSNLPADSQIRKDASKVVSDASINGGFQVWRDEAAEALLKAKNRELHNANIKSVGALLEGVAWMRDGAPAYAEKDTSVRAHTLANALSTSPAELNHEKAALAIFSTCGDLPITNVDDERREVLRDALNHKEERVGLAASWMLSESSVPSDRELAIDHLVNIATSADSATTGGEAARVLSAIITIGTLDDQLYTRNAWSKAYERGHKPWANPPADIPGDGPATVAAYFANAPRTELGQVIANGSKAEKEAVIKAITGWSDSDLSSNLINMRDVREPKAELRFDRNLSKGRSCIDGRPDPQEFNSFRLMLSAEDQLKHLNAYEVNARIDSVLASLRDGRSPGAPMMGSFGSPDGEGLRPKAKAAGRGMSKTEEQAFRDFLASIQAKPGSPSAATPSPSPSSPCSTTKPRSGSSGSLRQSGDASSVWRSAIRSDAPKLSSGSDKVEFMSAVKADNLFNGVAWLQKNSDGEGLTGSAKGDADHLKQMLSSPQPHNSRYVCEAIFASLTKDAIKAPEDPRRDVLTQGLTHKSERVQLASAWMLSNSAVVQDFEAASKALGYLAVDSSEPTIRAEAKALLRDMIAFGGDEHARTALGAWKNGWEHRGTNATPGDKPPELSDAYFAQKYAYHHPERVEELKHKTADERKAIVLQLHNQTSPDDKWSDMDLEARTQPTQYSPMLDTSLRLYPPSETPFKLPFFDVGPRDPMGIKSGSPFGGPDTSSSDRLSGRPTVRRFGAPEPSNRSKFAEFLQDNVDGSVLKGGRVTQNERGYVGLTFDGEQFGGDPRRRIELTGGAGDEAVQFLKSAPPEVMGPFAQDLFRYRPELSRRDSIPATDLAVMLKNWMDQKSFGRKHVVVSEEFNDKAVNDMVVLPFSTRRESEVSSDQFVQSWSALSEKRQRAREQNLNWELETALKFTPPEQNDGRPHWQPASKPTVTQPGVLKNPQMSLIDKYRTNVAMLLPEDIRTMAGASGEVSVSHLRHLADVSKAQGEQDILVSPTLGAKPGSFVVLDPKVIGTIRAHRVNGVLRNVNRDDR